MTHNTKQQSPHGTTRNPVLRVLFIIVGTVLAMTGGLLTIAAIALTFDGDAEVLMAMPFTLVNLVGGIYIIRNEIASGGAVRAAEDDERVVAVEPIGRAPEAEPKQSSAPAPIPAKPGTPKGGAADPSADIAHLVFRSTDLFATLRDLVRHENASPTTSDKLHLASMLEAAGIMDWQDAPATEGGRLSRNDHYWIRLGTDDLDARQYDILIAAEAALGINQDLPSLRTAHRDSQQARQGALHLMRTMCEQRVERGKLVAEGLRACYRTDDGTAVPQDFVVRATVCDAAECLRVPFRVVYDLRVNLEEGLVLLGVEVPRPRCMAIFTSDADEQAGLARAYALRLAALLAQHAFAASDEITRVVVNCHEHADQDTLVSLDIDRTAIQQLLKVAAGSDIETGFPTDRRIRASFAGDWFEPVDPFVALDDPLTTPQRARIYPELDHRPASEAVRLACGAQRISDLGINENAVRIAAWNDIRPTLGSTTEQAVSTLKAARNAASDITVAEACNRCMQALIDGKADLENLNNLASLFVDGSALDQAVARAGELLDDADGPEDPEAALKVLEAALAPIDDMGAYLDDETSVYRYFGSVSERIVHNRLIDEGGRQILLVPDSYFNAHSTASIALGMLGRFDEALEHVEVCRRLAPTSTFATMRKVRILEAQSRVYEAADLIRTTLRNAVTPRDAAICHYRLAYMEWKLGREDLAAACYVRSLAWDTEMSGMAREELEDLLSSSPGLERPTSEQAEALLAREGIPLGCVRSDGEETLAAAVACMDDGALLTARPLMATLFSMYGDDVVMGVYRSLNVTSLTAVASATG